MKIIQAIKTGSAVGTILCFIWTLAGCKAGKELPTQHEKKISIARDHDGLAAGLDPRAKQMILKHREDVARIDRESEEIKIGIQYYQQQNYPNALEHYLTAHQVAVGPKGVTGLLIAETYGKLGRYDDAIKMLQKMIDTKQYNEDGNAKAEELIRQYRQQLTQPASE